MSTGPYGQGLPGGFRRGLSPSNTPAPTTDGGGASTLVTVAEDATPPANDTPASILGARLLLDRFWTTVPNSVTDDFTRADSTSSPGGSWEVRAGTWGISSNQAYMPSGTSGVMVQRIDPPTDKVFVRARITASGSTPGPGLVISYTDERNYVYAIRAGGFATWNIVKMVAGTATSLGNTGFGATDDCTVTLYRNGTDYWITVRETANPQNLNTSSTFSVPEVQGLGVGLRAQGMAGTERYDDFVAGEWVDTQSDTSTGAEGVPAIAVSDGEVGQGVDNQTVVIPVSPAGDTGTGTDSHSITVTLSRSETGAGVDNQSGARTSTQSDTGTGADSGAVSASLTGSETGTGTDSHALSVTLSRSDTGAGTDDQTVVVSGGGTPIEDSDTGTGVDSHTILITFQSIVDSDEVRGFDLNWVRYTKGMTLLGAITRG